MLSELSIYSVQKSTYFESNAKVQLYPGIILFLITITCLQKQNLWGFIFHILMDILAGGYPPVILYILQLKYAIWEINILNI